MENIISQYDSEKTICKMLNECSKCRDYMVKNCICETDSKILKFLIDAYVCLELVTEQKKNLVFQNYVRQNYDIFFGFHTFIVNIKNTLRKQKQINDLLF